MSVRVKLDNKERGYYSSLHQAVDLNGTNQIGGAAAVQFFKKSGLSIEILKKIWLLSSPNNQTLDRDEFYVALKLISYAQNNMDVSHDAIQRQIPSPLPNFAHDTDDVFKIKGEQEKLYQQYINQLDPQDNLVSTSLAMNLFCKSALPQHQIQAIMNLVEMGLPMKPKLTIYQYTTIAHLISLVTQGVQLPIQLPQTLTDYISQYKPKILSGIQKLNTQDLYDMEFPTVEQSPGQKYAAFDSIAPMEKAQTPPVQVTQPQKQEAKLQKKQSFDLMGHYEQDAYIPEKLQTSSSQQGQSQQIQSQSQSKPQFDFQPIIDQNEKYKVEEKQLQENVNQTNELLHFFREQHEKQLKHSQQQVESMSRINESYTALLKKFSDENEIFQEEFNTIEHQKKKLIDQLSKQASDINQKFNINIASKYKNSKAQQIGIQEITDYATLIIDGLADHISNENDRKTQFELQIQKELKIQSDKIAELTTQMSKQKLQRQPSQLQNYIKTRDQNDDDDAYNASTSQPQLTTQPIHSVDSSKNIIVSQPNISESPKELLQSIPRIEMAEPQIEMKQPEFLFVNTEFPDTEEQVKATPIEFKSDFDQFAIEQIPASINADNSIQPKVGFGDFTMESIPKQESKPELPTTQHVVQDSFFQFGAFKQGDDVQVEIDMNNEFGNTTEWGDYDNNFGKDFQNTDFKW